MKTIFYSLAVVAASFFIMLSASAQYQRDYNNGYRPSSEDQCRDSREQSFYYYPQSNVYFSLTAGKYIFFDRNAWVVSERLPHSYRLRREPRFVVYHNGFDVWNDNRFHAMKYRDNRRFQPDVAYDHYNGYNANDGRNRDDSWRR